MTNVVFCGNFGRDKRLLAHFNGRVLLRPDHTIVLRIAYLAGSHFKQKQKSNFKLITFFLSK